MNINNLKGINLNLAKNQVSQQVKLNEQTVELKGGDVYDEILINGAKRLGFFDDFGKNLKDIVNEESSDIYTRYNPGFGQDGGRVAFADLVRALWRTLTK